jgi:lipoprotein
MKILKTHLSASFFAASCLGFSMIMSAASLRIFSSWGANSSPSQAQRAFLSFSKTSATRILCVFRAQFRGARLLYAELYSLQF